MPSPARVCECAATPAPSVRSVTGGAPKPLGPLLASAARLPTCPGRPRRRLALLRPFPPRRAPAPSPTALCPRRLRPARGPHAATSPAGDRAASYPSASRRARGRPGARGSGRGGRQARAAVLGRTAGLPSLERGTRRGPSEDAHSPRRSCGGRLPGPRRTAARPPSRPRRPRYELPPPPSRRHRSPVGFPASYGGAAPSPVRVRGAAGPPGIGGPAGGRPSAPGRAALTSRGTWCWR